MVRISKIFDKDGKILSEAEKMIKKEKKTDNIKLEEKINK